MNGRQISYVCVTRDHVSAPSGRYPFITLHLGEWAVCVADGRQGVTSSHEWASIEPAAVEMLTFNGMARRPAEPHHSTRTDDEQDALDTRG